MEWLDLPFFQSEQFKSIVAFLKQQRETGKLILPNAENVFRAFATTPFDQVKVVILGQDPYPTFGHAEGLSFSVPPSVKTLPPTLVNIFKELNSDIGSKKTDGSLLSWAQQGVLLLNTHLTVEQGKPASHAKLGWEKLTNEVLRTLSNEQDHIVFILWGSHAQAKSMYIDTDKHLIIASVHPSPLAAYKGFFGSKPFSRTNAYLVENGKLPISW